MIETTEILPGVVLRCCRDTRFKQGRLSFQFVRPMQKRESAFNALLPDVLLRGTQDHPSLRAINQHLDANYGVGMGALVRRVGDYQTCGFGFSMLEDRFALAGESVLEGVLNFLEELLTRPLVENGAFLPAIVDSEKKNLIATIESELNNKAAYAMGKLLKSMCRADTFGLPRLGETEDVTAIRPEELYDHFLRLRRESRIEVFYVGSADSEKLAGAIKTLAGKWERAYRGLPEQTTFIPVEGEHPTETMDIAQGKLSMGFITPVNNRHPQFAALQAFNVILGAGMTSKLFQNVREKLSLCYSVGSSYYGSKGILTVGAGIDFDKEEAARSEILRQLSLCQAGEITADELIAAKAAIRSGLQATHDTPGAIEGYYATAALSGMAMTPAQYLEAVERLTLDEVVAAANTVTYHSSHFLKGEDA
jgi:predicted Zn-dependent peptidase